MTYIVISKRQGALHIDGLEAATKPVAWAYDSGKVEEAGFVPYAAQSACAAVTRFGSFRFEHKKSDDLAEIIAYVNSRRFDKKICKRCDEALQALGN